MRSDLKMLAKVIRTATHMRAPAENASALRLAEKLHERFEATLRLQVGERRHDDSLALEDVGLDSLARATVNDRDGKRRSGPANPT
jgi:hypothetical protein